MECTLTDDHATSTRCHNSSTIVTGVGDEPVARQQWTRRFLLARDLVNLQARETAEHFPYQGFPYNTGNMWSCIILLKLRVLQGSNKV
ncbi:hypothetical protein TNCV_2350711 [Trichonephila clavipes]|uniref:Uncharacterized protein n=1 Tax=Trichonephila clavipes TaxID=2585209 RepID=A0A8X6T114_TRICX|nr:hypothetical protein TNCV_2350711 [Trichonephila clavipes]